MTEISSRPEAPAAPIRKGLDALTLSIVAVALGVVSGFGAFGFRALIGVFHNLLFLGRFSIVYDSNIHTPPGPWGLGVAVVPAIGALAVVFLVKTFAPEARGHGVPEVMDAVYYNKGVIRPVVAVVKSFASAMSIGSGGSVGREGPIIQIGAAVASSVGILTRASRWQLLTLVAAGGGAGIAATFNTPIGGVLFAVEVLMHEVSVRTLVPVALATATATYVGRYLLGSHPAFEIPAPVTPVASSIPLLLAYVVLGCLTAVLSVLFIRVLYGAEDLFERRLAKHEYLRHVLGMLIVGAIGATLLRFAGHYYVEGVGYATILDILSGAITSLPLLMLLLILKLAATSLTLGSGASGGVFSPSLFMGATLGAGFGIAMRALAPSLSVDPAAFALAGMAGVVAGATGAALTAIVMIFEMTLDYSVVLPMTITAAVSYGLRRALSVESIYSMKLTRRGHYISQALQSNAHLMRRVANLPLESAIVARPDAPAAELVASEELGARAYVVLVDESRIAGVISRDWILGHGPEVRVARSLGELARHDFVVVRDDTTLAALLAAMAASHASMGIVTTSISERDPSLSVAISGVITRAGVAEVIASGMELFGD